MLNFYEYHTSKNLDFYDEYSELLQSYYQYIVHKTDWINPQRVYSQTLHEDYAPILHIIKKDVHSALSYTYNIIGGRWPEVEPLIIQYPYHAYNYAKIILKGRWLEAEPKILKSPNITYLYLTDVVKEQWVECEDVIKDNPYHIYKYTTQILKHRWVEIEPFLKEGQSFWSNYCEFFGIQS